MTPPVPCPAPVAPARVRVSGKFLRCGGTKWFCHGVSYGPFKPNARGEPFPDDERLGTDFASIRAMGFNAVRIYDLPSEPLLSEAAAQGLHLILGIPWTDHVDFLGDRQRCKEIEARVRETALRFGSHDRVAALLIGNEIEKTLVRWMGPVKVKRFLEKLIEIARAAAPDCLLSYATYPSTEYLLPANADFVAVNVYLEEREAFERYLRRLQNLAGNRPLVITEFGVDALTRGEHRQAEIRGWQHECVQRHGLAGNVWFAFTDEWFRGGAEVVDWGFGLVTRERLSRLAASPCPPVATAPSGPRISVVVCTCNGSATLVECLESLGRQSYSDCEVIVIDDGSIDSTPEIARSFAQVRYHRQEHAGLSVARNQGAQLATGDIIAYTDDDCMADEDWLRQLAQAFDDPQWVAAGGPNIPPTARNRTESLVAAAPGGPSHVLLNDEEAEHLPGCNLAIRKSALAAIGGFRAPFVTAGDDVDVCWRLREAGGRLRFMPAAMVWHHRRLTVRSYLRQQSGYGLAEALLMKHHPRHFGPLGGARWRGLIYGAATGSLPPAEGSIFHGAFGLGLFQIIYTSSNAFCWFNLFAGVLWIVLAWIAWLLGCGAASLVILGVASFHAWQRMEGHHTGTIFGKAKLWLLCLMQPVVREWARLKGMIKLGAWPSFKPGQPAIRPPKKPCKRSGRVVELAFWSDHGVGREAWMREFRSVLAENKINAREDDGWNWYDFEVFNSVAVISMTEYHGEQKQLTRVAISHRSHRFFWFALLTLVMLGVLTAASIPHDLGGRSARAVEILLAAAAVTAAGALFQRWILWPLARSKTRHLVLVAARRAGLSHS